MPYADIKTPKFNIQLQKFIVGVMLRYSFCNSSRLFLFVRVFGLFGHFESRWHVLFSIGVEDMPSLGPKVFIWGDMCENCLVPKEFLYILGLKCHVPSGFGNVGSMGLTVI